MGMYNTETNRSTSTVETVSNNKSTELETKLENKVRQLAEQVLHMQAEIDRLNKTLRRHNSEINSVLGRVNRLK